MLYHLHFDESNVPYDDDPFHHDIYFCSDKEIDIDNIFTEIDNLKAQMDYEDAGYDDYDIDDKDLPANPLYEAFSDYGWHEKIDEAFNIVKDNHPEYNITIVEIEKYSTNIN